MAPKSKGNSPTSSLATRQEQGRRFRALYASLGFNANEVAQLLQVSTRSVHNWVSGAVPVPYMAMKLLRLMLRYELPGKDWDGWHLSAGKLYTPEGLALNPHDFTWWGLLVRRAAMFSVCYHELNHLRAAGRTAAAAAAMRLGAGQRTAAKSEPSSEAGRPAQPAGPNLLIGHISTGKTENLGNMRLPAGSWYLPGSVDFSHYERWDPMGKIKTGGQRDGRALPRAFLSQLDAAGRSAYTRDADKGSGLLGALMAKGGHQAPDLAARDAANKAELKRRTEASLEPPKGRPGRPKASKTAIKAAAVKAWSEVTGGRGVVLVNGKEVGRAGD